MSKGKKGTDDVNHWKGLVVGVAGAAVGVLAMKYYWQGVIALLGKDPRSEENKSDMHALDDIAVAGEHHQEGESSTEAIGRLAYQAVADKEPNKETKTALSYTVHWSYGLLLGGLYGAVRGGSGWVDIAGGLAYGTGVWLFGSELAIPMLGLSEGPTTQSLASHAYGLGAHFAYGLATSATTQLLYKLTP